MQFSIIAAAMSGLLIGASAKGINCEGAGSCAGAHAGGFKLSKLLNQAQGLDDNQWFQNGQHITCLKNIPGDNGVCAFLQGTGGLPGREIKRLLQELLNHGCENCGSVPAFYPSDNDISHHGELTVNWVSKP